MFDALKPFIKKGDTFLDVDCGHSPLAKHILRGGHSITGFDIAFNVIQHLQDIYPKGNWITLDDADAEFQGYSVLLLLGVTTPLYKVYSETYYETTKRLLGLNYARVVFVESADGADQTLYKQVCEMLEKVGHYVKKCEKKYDAEMKRASRRHYSIWIKREVIK